jgi:hypothetical protein
MMRFRTRSANCSKSFYGQLTSSRTVSNMNIGYCLFSSPRVFSGELRNLLTRYLHSPCDGKADESPSQPQFQVWGSDTACDAFLPAASSVWALPSEAPEPLHVLREILLMTFCAIYATPISATA